MSVTRKKSSTFIYVVVLCALVSVLPVYVSAQTISKYSELKDSEVFLSTFSKPQTSLIPYGAPQTGYGAGAPTLHRMSGKSSIPLLIIVFSLLLGCGMFYVIRDWMGLKSNLISSM